MKYEIITTSVYPCFRKPQQVKLTSHINVCDPRLYWYTSEKINCLSLPLVFRVQQCDFYHHHVAGQPQQLLQSLDLHVLQWTSPSWHPTLFFLLWEPPVQSQEAILQWEPLQPENYDLASHSPEHPSCWSWHWNPNAAGKPERYLPAFWQCSVWIRSTLEVLAGGDRWLMIVACL